ncbi:MAG: insulinase family protein [Treponema sp.]|nr:insulinase family protein [Treponema sp.]
MKKLILSTIILFLCCGLFAHQQEQQKEQVVQTELSNKIPVYVKQIPGSQISSVYIVVNGGTDYLTPETSGLENALFSMMVMGSEKYNYYDLRNFIFNTQSSFVPSSSRDGSVLGMVSLDYYFEETFDRFIDGFLNPSFAEKEYNNLITKYQQDLQSMLNDPSSMGFYYAEMLVYQNHPFSTSSAVLPESIDNITIPAMKKLHSQILDSRRISVVAVGSVDLQKLLVQLETTLGKIKPQNYPLKNQKIPEVTISGENLVTVHQAAKENAYILRIFPSPAVTDENYVTARIVCDVFSDILYNVVREKYGVCYTPGTNILSSDAPFGFEYLYRTSNLKDFAKYMEVARKIMLDGKIVSGVNDKGEFVYKNLEENLEGYINSYINKKYSSQGTTSGIAGRMCASLLQFGDIYSADLLTEKVKKVTTSDVLSVFKKYWVDMDSIWVAVVGPDEEDKVVFSQIEN